MEIAERKVRARREAFARRKAAREAHGPAPQAATEALVETLLAARPTVVAGYLPIRTEIDPRPAMLRLHAQAVRLCVPVIDSPGLPLLFREWRPEATLEPGPFGAEVPADGEWLTPDALVCPLVAFDDGLFRLGYGGGFYDRTLARLRARSAPLAVGLAYADQRAASLPREDTDLPLDAVATEAGLLRAPPG